MLIEQSADLGQDITKLVRFGLIAKSNFVTKPDSIAQSEVFQTHGGQLAIGNGNDRSLEGPQTCGPQADVLHSPLELARLAKIADLDGLVRDDHDAPKQILQGLLRRKGD